MSVPEMLLTGWACLAAAMALVWWVSQRSRNAGSVDVVWTFGLAFLALLYSATLPGWLPRKLLVLSLVMTWALRLGVHLIRRVRSEAEDGRYARLRREQGQRFGIWSFVFFQVQALLDVVLSLPLLVVMLSTSAGWRWADLLGAALFVTALVGEAIADRQLWRWRQSPANRGRTCREGLWRYSRHPNYFFEWIHWLAYPVIGIGLPYGGWLWLAPLLMLFLVLKVTGIPPTEQQSLESRGDDYRAYQQTTNAFFPGPPRALLTKTGTPS